MNARIYIGPTQKFVIELSGNTYQHKDYLKYHGYFLIKDDCGSRWAKTATTTAAAKALLVEARCLNSNRPSVVNHTEVTAWLENH